MLDYSCFILEKVIRFILIFVRMVNELHVQNPFMFATCFTLPTFATLVMKHVILRIFSPNFVTYVDCSQKD